MSSKPRTPRYWPRMKVRGAARKRQSALYAFQRLGDIVSIEIVPNMHAFVEALQRSINATAMMRREYGDTPVTKEEHAEQ